MPTAVAVRPRALAPRWWAGAADAAGLAVLVLVVATWIGGGGPGDLTAGVGPALASVGRLAGLAAAALLLVAIALVARIPLLERSFGQAELTRVHRQLARVAAWLFVAHIVAVPAGYAVRTGAGLVAITWETVTTQPGVLAAVAGAVLAGAAALTSWWRLRARLRYEAWHLTHVLGYLGAALLVPHMVWTGSSFDAQPWARAAWTALWVGLGVAVLGWRVVVPALRSRRAGLRVAAGQDLGGGVWAVDVVGDVASLRAATGQFLYWRVHDGPGWTRAHPISATVLPDGGLRLTVRVAGDGTARLAGALPGTRLSVEGPYGRLTLGAAAPDAPLAFFGAGVGVAPMVALAEQAVGTGRDVVVVSRAHDEESLVLRGDLQALPARVVEAVGGRSAVAPAWPAAMVEGAGGAGGAVVLRVVPDVAGREVFVCGPGEWTDALVRELAAAGVPRGQIHRERFSW